MSKLDAESLYSGESYENLRPVYVIFLCPFDPKGYDLKRYTFKYECQEVENIALNTKSAIIYLNATGTKGTIRPGLQDFYDLMSAKQKQVNDTKFMRSITTTMKNYSKTSEWRQHKMSVEQLIEENTVETIKKVINGAKAINMSNDQTLNLLKQGFSNNFSEEELKKFIKETK